MKKRILSFILALIVLVGARVKVKATDTYEFDFKEYSVADNLDDVLISENIKSYIKEKYNLDSLYGFNFNNVLSINLSNFTMDDLQELKKFKNLMYLSLSNSVIEDSTFLKDNKSLCSLSLYNCKLDDLTCLKDSLVNNIDISNCCITNDLVQYFPDSLVNLRLFKEGVINDLSLLPSVCKNIKNISLIYCSGIVDFSFIKELKELESLDAKETPACTEDILEYIRNNDISTNLNNEDVLINERLMDILNSIISDDMSDRDKVREICLYIKHNIDKVIFDNNASIHKPLNTVLENKECTYIAISYFMNSLFNLANINSYDIIGKFNSWNLIEVDDKYYYINMSKSNLSFLIDWFNIGFYYMQDPENVLLSDMIKLEKLNLPEEQINNIKNDNYNKNFFERNFSNLKLDILYLILIFYFLSEVKHDINVKKILKKYNK